MDDLTAQGAGGIAGRIRDWHHAILLADRWPRRAIAGIAGLIAALALQPLDLWPAFFVAFPLLVLLLDGTGDATRPRRADLAAAAGIGWFFGFGYFLAGLWWLGAAFLAGGDQFIWLMPLGVVGLPAFLALFPAFGMMVARLLWSRSAARVLALAFGLSLSEWVRSWIFTGFPWNGFGQAFANELVLVQIVSVIGTETLGVVAIAVAALPALAIAARSRAGRVWPLAVIGLVLAAATAFGMMRLQASGGVAVDFRTMPFVPNVKLRIMQPNVAQDAKNATRDGMKELESFLALSDSAKGPHASGIADVTHLIWPEAPFAFVLERKPQAIRAIRDYLPPGTVLVTGAVRAEPESPERYRFFNSIHVIDRNGFIGTYDKVHLVPFGEYLPFEQVLRAIGLKQFVNVIGGFTASPARRPLAIPGLPPVVPTICFENIFPRDLAGSVDGEGVFMNVTNDAWFGYTPGPYQHLAQARLRSVEFGQPMVRAANSGISAVFDAYGRVIAALPLGRADVLDAPLPAGLSKTLYKRIGWYSFAAVMIGFLLIGVFGRLKA